jgi:biopolymer transport protein ExbB
MAEHLGLLHFLQHTDAVGYFVIATLLPMSMATWYLILVKAWQLRLVAGRGRGFLSRFRSVSSPEAAYKAMAREVPNEPFGRLARAGWIACRQASQPRGDRVIELASTDDFLAAALTHAVAAELAELEAGLAMLSSVAATAPFVGLFGTVSGIYHALLAIGATGQASLDQVAGAVGEALIMTGGGLAVAIPAALGHNALSHSVRKLAGRLEYFGHEVFVLLTTGTLDFPGVAESGETEGLPEIAMTEPADGL